LFAVATPGNRLLLESQGQPATLEPLVMATAAESPVEESGIPVPTVEGVAAGSWPGEITASPNAAEKPEEVPPAVWEQAAVVAATLWQLIRPELVASQPVSASAGPVLQTAAAPDGQRIGPAFPEARPVPPAAVSTQAVALPVPVVAPEVPVLEPSCFLAPDRALEFRVTVPAPAGGLPVAAQAELAVPGQAVIRVELAGMETAAGPQAAAPENFAGKKSPAGLPADVTAAAAERKFVLTGDKQVTPRSPRAGIAVAQNDGTMPAAPTEEIRATRKPQDSTVLPVRAEFQVAQTPVERITMPAPGPAGQTFASRAVETVTGLVEAQFSASMQKSGSVQLRLKFGSEDLSVRVAIRDGVVHTDFQTDSAPLRAALTREWQAVAAQSPQQMMRYLEPVFSSASPATASAGGDTAQQHSTRQQQAQSGAPYGSAASPFARRSLVPENFVPEPAVARTPAFLPTSLRLSALA
jgi:hypothetical protein